ncbi:MAG: HEAT repeat domain-containing protein [Desulfosarcina sp.]|nr:HEAT repeat domain-containing protein [Desulfobacterales bacterium]
MQKVSSIHPTAIGLAITFLLLTATGCTKTFNIGTPEPSSIVYDQPYSKASQLGISDQRREADRNISTGTLPVVLKNMEDESDFLGRNLQAALKSRGINLNYAPDSTTDLIINVHKYRIRNLRTTGFSPYWTFTTFSGDLVADGKTNRITFYFKRGKVPVWAFREVEEPCYNVPVSLMVKEIASKINRCHFGLQAPSDKVRALAEDVENNFNKYSFLKVLELGYTNNKDAIKPLRALTEHHDSMVRVCAISSLGLLGADGELALLKNIYRTRDNIEQSMALKAIGDLGTPEARAFLQSVKDSEAYENEMIREVVDLYF